MRGPFCVATGVATFPARDGFMRYETAIAHRMADPNVTARERELTSRVRV